MTIYVGRTLDPEDMIEIIIGPEQSVVVTPKQARSIRLGIDRALRERDREADNMLAKWKAQGANRYYSSSGSSGGEHGGVTLFVLNPDTHKREQSVTGTGSTYILAIHDALAKWEEAVKGKGE